MTMTVSQFTIRADAPLRIGNETRVSNYVQSADYVPGSTLRGAVAAQLLAHLPPPDPDYGRNHELRSQEEAPAFWRVFGAEHPPRFGYAYPTRAGGMAYPFPATARTCKRYPGLATESADERHGVFDTLMEQVAYDLASDPHLRRATGLLPELGDGLLKLPAQYNPRCPECGRPVKPAQGYYTLQDGKIVGSERVPISRATHVGINRSRGVAEDALLFTQEALDGEALIFRGLITYDETYAAELGEVLALDGSTTHLLLGAGRSRGLGDVSVTLEPPPRLKAMGDRLDELRWGFDEALLPTYQANGHATFELQGRLFSVTLCAPGVFTDPAGLPALWPDLTTAGLSHATPVRAWARTTLVGGWDAAASLPRRTRQAVQAGAVFLYYVPPGTLEDEEALSELVRRLEALEREGVGDLREMGYGQVQVCAPFHCR